MKVIHFVLPPLSVFRNYPRNFRGCSDLSRGGRSTEFVSVSEMGKLSSDSSRPQDKAKINCGRGMRPVWQRNKKNKKKFLSRLARSSSRSSSFRAVIHSQMLNVMAGRAIKSRHKRSGIANLSRLKSLKSPAPSNPIFAWLVIVTLRP